MIAVIFTGGTISMRIDASAGGAVPSLRGRDLLALAPGLAAIAELDVDDWGTFPGPHMTLDRMWELRSRIVFHLARPEVEGIVVTHGTDTLEESAYLVARSVRCGKPVVFTGAMRTSSDIVWDGPANLTAAVRVASNVASAGRGVMVAFADCIYSALDVTKVNTNALDAFAAIGGGAIGGVDGMRVSFAGELPRVPDVIDAPALASPVDIIDAYAGADSRLLEQSRQTARGVVVAALGRGNVPVAMVDGIEGCLRGGVPVVIASRSPHGRVATTYAYEGAARRLVEKGALLAGGRRPQQARIDLMLALGAGIDPRHLFPD